MHIPKKCCGKKKREAQELQRLKEECYYAAQLESEALGMEVWGVCAADQACGVGIKRAGHSVSVQHERTHSDKVAFECTISSI